MRAFLFVVLVLGTYFGSTFVVEKKIPALSDKSKSVLLQIPSAGLNLSKWERLQTESQSLPAIYPFTLIQDIITELQSLVVLSAQLEIPSTKESQIETQYFLNLLVDLKKGHQKLKNTADILDKFPAITLSESEKSELQTQKEKLQTVLDTTKDIIVLEKILKKSIKDEDRILLLLQNQNEPRSSGGFVGSFIVIDIDAKNISWKFMDTYSLDRKVPLSAQEPAPLFFHNLSKTISLRDANFWPHFPTTSQKYINFFEAANEKPPTTIFAINLNIIEKVLQFTGAIDLPQWGLQLDAHNFDTGLQFLVEAKVSGRFSVKKPVMVFGEALFKKIKLLDPLYAKNYLQHFDFENFFVTQKNLQAYSSHKSLQKLFSKWQIDGLMKTKKEIDNFLYFDFVSVGANKSEKFLWTKLQHNSEVSKDGRVKNTLSIKRTHSLAENEIQNLLHFESLPPNIKDLLSNDLLWKLGNGENRTLLRIYVPKKAKLLKQINPSGKVITTYSDDKKYSVFWVPLNVLPKESLNVLLEYETPLERGSQNWRPYFLEVVGTPARNKTEFLSTISHNSTGKFEAQTENIGKSIPLQDMDIRAVVNFK